MADKTKVSWAKLKVGLMALAALAIVFVLVFLMAGSQGLFQSKAELFTYLRDARGLVQGAPVTLSGVDIGGKITKVENTLSNDPARAVKITMQVGASYLSSIPVDSRTEMASASLLGSYTLNIIRGMSKDSVKSGAVLSSTETAQISDLYRQSSTALAALQDAVTKIDDIITQVQVGKGSIGKLYVDETLYNNAVDITKQLKDLAVDLHTTIDSSDNSFGKLLHDKGELLDRINAGVESLDKTVDGAPKIVDGINNGQGTLGQLAQNPAMYDDFRQILGDVHTLLAGIQAGKGTAGKLLSTDEFGDQIKTTLDKVDALLDKMDNGNGTVAKLLNDPSLFDDLDSTTRETEGLLKDFRANPKKFLRIRMTIF